MFGIDDDFFEIGGDSLTVMRACGLSFKYQFDVETQDYYDHRTIRKISKKIIEEIQMIKTFNEIKENDEIIRARVYDTIKFDIGKNEFGNILVTGATGFLGVHIVDYLLSNSNSIIYCLVRGKNRNDSKKRLLENLKFYFDDKYIDFIDNRLLVLCGDISEAGLGLDILTYLELAKNINTIFHVAALVKFRGDYEDFNRINTNGTKKIAEFAIKYNIKLNHISTTGVSGNRVKQDRYDLRLYEDTLDIGQNYEENVYIKSKFEAEKHINELMKKGLSASIFRVGFVTSRFSDGVFQKNPNENVFYSMLKTLLETKTITRNMCNEQLEFTPVDLCSKAICEIAIKPEANNKRFHIVNHNKITVDEFLHFSTEVLNFKYSVLEDDSFINFIEYLREKKQLSDKKIDLIINEFDFRKVFGKEYHVEVDTDYTKSFLEQLNFIWTKVELDYIEKILNYLVKIDYIYLDI